jgi:LemA protein
MTVVLAVLGALVLVGIFLIYNRGIRLKNQQAEAWSGVDVQLKKRHDLIPSLVECVRGYKAHEAEVLERTTASRSTPSEVVEGIRKIFAVAEAYPDLKASENFRQLASQLVLIEDDLQYARRYYNGSVRDYRNFAESFPAVLLAGVFGFRPGEFFEVENVIERSAPEVQL